MVDTAEVLLFPVRFQEWLTFPFSSLQSFHNTETLSKLRGDIIHRVATDLQVNQSLSRLVS